MPKRYLLVGLCAGAMFIAYTDRVNISVAAIQMQADFGWTETTKGIVLSSFFFGYLLTQVLGGWLANRFGGRRVLGLAVISWSILTLVTPWAAALAFGVLIAARVALGMGESLAGPSIYNILNRWVPPGERSRALALVLTGSTLGAPLALALTGWLVGSFGWEMSFYGFAALGFVWAAVYFWMTSEDPADHPTISNEERDLLAKHGDDNSPIDKPPVPWGTIVRQPAVWALAFNNFCALWTVYVFLAWLPSYFSAVQGLSLTSAGFYSAAPWVTMAIMLNVAGWLADGMIARGRSRTFVRKLMQSVGLLGSAGFLLFVGQAATPLAALVLTCGGLGMSAFCYSGFAVNPLDLSPKYADVLVGISNTFGTLPGIIGVAVTGWLVDITGAYSAAFFLAAGISVAGTIVFLAFGTGRQVID